MWSPWGRKRAFQLRSLRPGPWPSVLSDSPSDFTITCFCQMPHGLHRTPTYILPCDPHNRPAKPSSSDDVGQAQRGEVLCQKSQSSPNEGLHPGFFDFTIPSQEGGDVAPRSG